MFIEINQRLRVKHLTRSTSPPLYERDLPGKIVERRCQVPIYAEPAGKTTRNARDSGAVKTLRTKAVLFYKPNLKRRVKAVIPVNGVAAQQRTSTWDM
jgi:hypothetical protein